MLKADIQKKLYGQQGEIHLKVSFELGKEECLSLYGESGSGKTTILRCLSGLCSPDKGIIEYDGKLLFHSQKKINVKPQKRNIGFMFQNYLLFPNMTIYQNLLYAAKFIKDKDASKKLMDELLQITNLKLLINQKPSQLSGGQKQRVAFLNALVSGSKLLFLDEPFSALDLKMHRTLQTALKNFNEGFQTNTILVSHNLADIFKLTNRVLYIQKGKIFQAGTPTEVFLKQEQFMLDAEIVSIKEETEKREKKKDKSYIVTLLANNTPVNISLQHQEVKNYSVGEQVQINTKSLFPNIIKKN